MLVANVSSYVSHAEYVPGKVSVYESPGNKSAAVAKARYSVRTDESDGTEASSGSGGEYSKECSSAGSYSKSYKAWVRWAELVKV